MESYSDINKYILRKSKDGIIDKEYALRIIQAISNEKAAGDYAIIGMECCTALADSKEELWENLMNQTAAIRHMPQKRIDQIKNALGIDIGDSRQTALVGYMEKLDEFDPTFFRISNNEAKLMDPKQRIFLEVFYHALEDAGYAAESLDGRKVGVFIGTDHSSDMLISYKQMMSEPNILGETGTVSGILARRPAYIFNLHGPAVVIDTACSSSMVALHMACQAIASGDCELSVIGGVNVILYSNNESKFSDIESQSSLIKSFDKNAAGTNWGEGFSAIVIKPLKKAVRDRDNILAVIKGTAVNNDGASNGIVSPNPEAQEELISRLLKETKINPESISYVECHGTGTVIGDQIELKSLTNAYRKYTNRKQFCGVGSIKPNIGHLVGGAALTGIIKLVLSFKNGVIPPSINFEQPNPLIKFVDSPFFIVDQATKWEDKKGRVVRAAISSFGFTGTNTHAILEAPPKQDEISQADRFELVTLSFQHREMADTMIQKYLDFLKENHASINLADFCYTANVGRRDNLWRLAFVVNSIKELINQMQKKQNELRSDADLFWTREDKPIEYSREIKEKIRQFNNSGRNSWALLNEISQLYQDGATINWQDFYHGCVRSRISIPVTALKRTALWVDENQRSYANKYQRQQTDLSHGLYKPVWEIANQDQTPCEPGLYLLFVNGRSMEQKVIDYLNQNSNEVICIAEAGANVDWAEYEINSTAEDDYITTLEDISTKKKGSYRIIYFWGMKVETNPEEAYQKLARLLGAIVRIRLDAIVKVVTDRAFAITTADRYLSGNSQNAMLGLCRTFRKETLSLRCDGVDIDSRELKQRSALLVFYQELIRETPVSDNTTMIGLRKGLRFTEYYQIITPRRTTRGTSKILNGGIYLITGGTGLMWIGLAEKIVLKYEVKLIILSGIDYGELEGGWKEHGTSEEKLDLTNQIYDLQQEKSVSILNVDITDYDMVKSRIDAWEKINGAINGVFHLAGADIDQGKSRNAVHSQKMFREKVNGLAVIHRVFQKRKIDFIVLFSSLYSFMGVPGQSSEHGANMYLDAYANKERPNNPERKIVSIDWDNLIVGSISSEYKTGAKEHHADEFDFGNGITPEECVEVIEWALELEEPQIYVSKNEITEMKYRIDEMVNGMNTKSNQEKAQKYSERPELSVPYQEPQNKIQKHLTIIWEKIFEINKVGINDDFFELGGDSIYAIRIVNEIDNRYAVEVVDILRFLTIAMLEREISFNLLHLKDKYDNAKKILRNLAEESVLCAEEQEKEQHYLDRVAQLEHIEYLQAKQIQNILLLGVTGYIGIHLLYELLKQTDAVIYLLIRNMKAMAEKRLKDTVLDYYGIQFYEEYQERIIVIEGDASQNHFGLNKNTYNMLAEKIECVVNSAGKVDHYGKYEEFYTANVEVVDNVIVFAKTTRKKEIHHMSTRGIIMGNTTDQRDVVFTEDDIDFGQVLPDNYPESKRVAERRLEQARNDGLAVNIYRIGDVFGDSITGKFQKNIEQNAVYLELRAMMKFDCIVSAPFQLWDLIFVDILGHYIVKIISNDNIINETIHLFSNNNRLSVDDWNQAFLELGIHKRKVDIDEFMDYLYNNHNDPEMKSYVSDFVVHTNLLDFDEYSRFHTHSERTELILKKIGLIWHKPNKEELIRSLQYGKEVGFFDF